MKKSILDPYTKLFADPSHMLAYTCLIDEPYHIHMDDIRKINQMCVAYPSVSADGPIATGRTTSEAIGMREFYKDLNAYRRTHNQISPIEEAAYVTARMIYEPVFEERNNQTALLSGVYCLNQAGYDVNMDPYWMLDVQEKLYFKNEFEDFSDYVAYFEAFYYDKLANLVKDPALAKIAAKINEATLEDAAEEDYNLD